jgi:Carboxypeptidase regulatory-like domain
VRRVLACGVSLFAMLLLLSAVASAQSGSGIAGVVKDSSGAVLPGVTVEAASPALIEKVRTVVTDGDGQYKVVGLVPGVYSVTFTLTGFSTVKREGIELTASFTATVNADLRVGSLQETVTVTGETPTVDIQNVVQQRVMTRDVINAIPAGTKSVASIGVLIPGVVTQTQDVGGTAFSATAIAIHGSRFNEQQLLYDGVFYNHGAGSGGNFNTIVPNDATVQEVSLEVGSTSAESPNGGLRTNIIPRDGGNTFRGFFFGSFTDSKLQAGNLDDSLKLLGLVSVPQVTRIYDIDPAFGGPLRKEKVWFYGSYRKQNSQQTVADRYFNLTPTAPAYTPDFGSQAQNNEENGNQSLRVTWQVNTKNKLSVQGQNGQQKRPYYGYACCNAFTTSPEATFYSESRPMYLVQSSWNSPVTSRLLLEASAGGASKNFETYLQPGMSPTQPSWTELSTGVIWGNYSGVYGANANFQFNTRLAASYVTGSHAAKFGITYMHSSSHVTQSVVNNGVTYQLNGGAGANGVITGTPSRVTVFATPLTLDAVMKANMGLFAQDQWTIRRLTLNLGVRFDYFNAYVPAQHINPGPNVPTRNVDFAQVDNVPDWKNTSPRLGASYDLFGTGKTAVKVSLGRYMEAPNLTTITRVMDPAAAIVNSATRTWNDANRDLVPQESELGPTNVNFGTSVITQAYADDVRTTRGYNWEGSASIQHEVAKNVSVNVAYFRRWFGNLTVTQNTRVTTGDFSPYCITVPADSRLPGGGGGQLCGLNDVNTNRFGQSFSLIQEADHFGTQEDVFDGIDVSANARLPKGVVVQGGLSAGRERTNNCYAMNDLTLVSFNTGTNFTAGTPRLSEYCDVRPPFQPNVKALAVYPLPWWGLQTSATYQSLPGPQILANATIRNADIVPSLGRSLSACPATGACNATVAVSLIPPGTLFGDRLHQVDFRVSKAFKLAQGRRVQGMVDIYNLLNGSAVITQNNSFGSAWLRPTQILQARLVKFGFQLDF